MPNYYRFHWDTEAPANGLRLATIAEQPDTDFSWITGSRIRQPVEEPIRSTLSDTAGPDMPDVFLADWIPLFSDRVVKTLTDAGVDNIDTYAAEILDPRSGKTWRDYKAANVIGLVECVDMKKSKYDRSSSFPMIEFERIVLNEKKVKQARMFRLAENPSFILVSEPVKKAFDDGNWVGLKLIALDDDDAY
jgi:hypothetical protein